MPDDAVSKAAGAMSKRFDGKSRKMTLPEGQQSVDSGGSSNAEETTESVRRDASSICKVLNERNGNAPEVEEDDDETFSLLSSL